METREFPTAVIASLSTGVALCEFDKIHEAAEYLMGHPIWTHHFADEALWKAMRHKVFDQCPGMPFVMTNVTRDNYQEHVAALEEEIGPTVTIRKGDGKTAMSPLDGLPEGKSTIILGGNS